MLRITDQYLWNFIFSIFFVILVIMGAIILESEAYKSFGELTLLDFAVISLATYRFIRLMVNDNITKFFREQFWDVKQSRSKLVLIKPESGPRRTIADLLSCPWCFGAWATAIIIFFYLLTPFAQFPVFILAIAGVGTWFHQVAQLTGYKAQQTKNQVESGL